MPMNVGGRDGTVGPITSGPAGTSVTVSYPEIPPVPGPAQAAGVETYENVTDPQLRRLEQAKAGDDKVTVVCDAAGKPTTVTQQ